MKSNKNSANQDAKNYSKKVISFIFFESTKKKILNSKKNQADEFIILNDEEDCGPEAIERCKPVCQFFAFDQKAFDMCEFACETSRRCKDPKNLPKRETACIFLKEF